MNSSWIQYFKPTAENGGVPRLLSRNSFILLFVLGAGLIASGVFLYYRELALLASPASYGASELVALVNGSRIADGEAPLAVSDALTRAATDKIEDMLAGQYFAHVSPSGTTAWTLMRAEGYRYAAAGENLARDFVTAERAHAAFMASPTHRDNILRSSFTEIGVAVGQGLFEGRPVIFIAEYFGAPSRVPVPAPVAAAAEPAPVAATAPTPATTAQAVVEEAPLAERIADVATAPAQTLSRAGSYQAGATTVAIIGLAAVLVALGGVVFAAGSRPVGVILRALVLIIVFGFAAFFLRFGTPLANLTPPTADSFVESGN